MFRYIIWDFDGTLVNTYPEIARAVNQALATFGKSVSLERVIELSSISLDFCRSELSKEFALSKEALDEQFGICYETVNVAAQRPFPFVIEVCKKVQELGGQNFIVTHRRKESLRELLSIHDLHSYVTDIVAGDDGFPRKPDPSAMRYLLEKHHLPIDKVLVIGDRPIDILAGQAIGAKTCLFRASFPDVLPHMTIKGFEELLIFMEEPEK
jgi:phosphoglycolate phosphatase-like HAD superfamily hydrolase